jgi:hypothetical protein
MEIKILGMKVNLLNLAMCALVVMVVHTIVLGSCSRLSLAEIKEGMANMGAPMMHKMGEGVKGAYDTKKMEHKAANLEAHKGPVAPLEAGHMHLFAKNEFKPECCVPMSSNASSSDGCACITKEQVDYINMRGGNRSSAAVY